MEFIEGNNFEKIRRDIRKTKGKTIIFSSNDDELNRKILEKEGIDVLLLKQAKRKDFQKQRNSGLNQVLAKVAKKKNITIGVDLDEIILNKDQQKSEILARVKQNIKLCNKHKLKMKFISPSNIKRNSHDIKALGLVLGMPTQIVKGL